jgi:hypothetical protein
MGAKTNAQAKAPAASDKVVKAVKPVVDETTTAPPTDPVDTVDGDGTNAPPDAPNPDDVADPVEQKADKPVLKGKAKLTFPLIALIKKYDDKIPAQVADQDALDLLVTTHGAENVEVQQ